MGRSKKRYQAEVHLGLLAIVFALVFLNFSSNLVIYRARETKSESLLADLQSAALAIGRTLPSLAEPQLSEQQEAQLKRTFLLDQIYIFPTRPADESMATRRLWFRAVARQLPITQVEDLTEKLFTADFNCLTRGGGSQYFLVSPLVSNPHNLLILSREDPELAYLDDGQRTVTVMGTVAVVVLAIMYLLLSKLIFAPLRRLKAEAKQAGRHLDDENDDADAVVEEYRRVINELQDQERKLLLLNEAISRKADSLEQFNNYLLQSIRSGIVTVDLEGNIVTVNNAASEMLGLDIESCRGEPYPTSMAEKSVLTDAITQTLASLKATDYRETDMTDPKGRLLTVGVSTSVITGGNDQPLGVSLLLNDMTEITRLRGELEVKERMAVMGEMTGGLAHQLRNSMGAISGYLTLLKKRLDKRHVVEDSVTALAAEAREAQDLIERFLQFSRPLEINGAPEPLSDLVHDVVKSYQVRSDWPQVRFVVQAETEVTAVIDVLLFKQALGNLIENAALAYDDDGGEVAVGVTVSRENVVVSVTDFGCGIPAEDQEKIFTPFFSSRAAGTGLGLPLVHKVVDLHGGRLTVSSDPDQGTVFTIFLPVAPQPNGNLSHRSGSSAEIIS